MPLHASIVGESAPPATHAVDARWLMAYAASLNDMNPRYIDTAAAEVIAHPLFPVCLEWPVILGTRAMAGSEHLTPAEAARGVHAAHDLHLYRPIREGETLTTTATMIGVKEIRPGASYHMRLDTRNDAGELVTRTFQQGIYRGVPVTGDARYAEAPPELPALADPSGDAGREIAVGAGAAHTDTECARIWNPIHTDRKVALAAGLPDIILHGTATMALALTSIVDRFAEGDPTRITRLGGRFAAMVLMPSCIRVQAVASDKVISYQVLTEAGEKAISGGFVCLR